MKFLLIDTDSVGLALAYRAAKAGHEVRHFIKPKAYANLTVGDGFKGITRIDNYIPSMKWADLVFCTSNDDYIDRMDFFRKQGVNIFAPSKASANLEIKRGDGMKFLEKHDIEVPEYKIFQTLADAEKHVLKTEERFVFKTLGDNEDKSLSYCAKSPADLVERLRRWQRLKLNPKGPVMLQKFIPGIEFAVSCWMGTNGFIGKFNENFEGKKLLSGDFGPNCGESGTVQKYVEDSLLADMVLAPLEDSLVQMGHLGDVDVNCIIDEKGKPWPLEFTMRPGWPAFNIMLNEHKGDPIEWMLDACKGKDTTNQTLDHAVGIVVAQPDYPYSNLTKKETDGIPIYGVTKKNDPYIQPQSVKKMKHADMEGDKLVEREIWSTAGDYLLVVTGTGKTVRKAAERAYSTIDEIKIPDMIVRDDIGERLEKQIPELQKFGFAMEFDY